MYDQAGTNLPLELLQEIHLQDDEVRRGAGDDAGAADGGRVSDGQEEQVPTFCIFRRPTTSHVSGFHVRSFSLKLK